MDDILNLVEDVSEQAWADHYQLLFEEYINHNVIRYIDIEKIYLTLSTQRKGWLMDAVLSSEVSYRSRFFVTHFDGSLEMSQKALSYSNEIELPSQILEEAKRVLSHDKDSPISKVLLDGISSIKN